MQLLDILFFAAIAAFLVFRLWSVLGRRNGLDRRPPMSSWSPRGREEEAAPSNAKRAKERVVQLPGTHREDSAPARAPGAEGPMAQTFEAFRQKDRAFDINEFLAGAKAAFEAIVAAFAQGDRKTLRALLSKEVFSRFAAALDAREAKGEQSEVTITGILQTEVMDAALQGGAGRITVRFRSEQIQFTRNKDGAIVVGDPSTLRTVTDIWTFARDLGSRDPNWLLVATQVPA